MRFFSRTSRRIIALVMGVFILFVLMLILLGLVEQRQQRELINYEIRQNEVQTANIINLTGQSLYNFSYDYTYWDEMVQFVKNPDQTWAEANIDISIGSYQCHAVWVLNPQGKIIHHVQLKPWETLEAGWLNDRFKAHLKDSPFMHFYLRGKETMMEIRTAPIQYSADSERNGPPQGWFVAGRIMDQSWKDKLGTLLNSEVNINLTGIGLAGGNEYKNGVYRQFIPLYGWNGELQGSVSVNSTIIAGSLSQKGSTTRFILTVVIALLTLAILGWGLSRWIALPLHSISEALETETPGPLKGLEKNPTEMGLIAGMVSAFLKQKSKLLQEIDERRILQGQLHFLAYHDPLTGLPNRVLFHDRLSQNISRARRKNVTVAVFFIDLDSFKSINDTMGHLVGDQVLKQVAVRLEDAVRDSDTVCRMGGDEFTIITGDVDDIPEVNRIAERILHTFDEPIEIEDMALRVQSSIGISLFPANGVEPGTLMKNADIAMYRAKGAGKNNYQFFSQDMSSEVTERILLERNLRKAMENEEFCLFYQPQVSVVDGRITGIEALIRWKDEQGGYLRPDLFLPIAEECGLIIPIGDWVVKQACLDLALLTANGHTNLTLAVNLSARQLYSRNIVDTVKSALSQHSLQPGRLELEITESSAMDDMEKSLEIIGQFQKMGIRIAIDDFGTGYSSLSYLKRFQINTLKIGQTFIKNITKRMEDKAIFEAIVKLAGVLSIEQLVTEGVETEEQLKLVSQARQSVIQGYLFSKPLPIDELEKLLDDSREHFQEIIHRVIPGAENK